MPPKKISNVLKPSSKLSDQTTKPEVHHNTRYKKSSINSHQAIGNRKNAESAATATQLTRHTRSPHVKKVANTQNKTVPVNKKALVKPISATGTNKAINKPQSATTAKISTNVVQTRNRQTKRGIVTKPSTVSKLNLVNKKTVSTATASATASATKRKQTGNSSAPDHKIAKKNVGNLQQVPRFTVSVEPVPVKKTPIEVTDQVQSGADSIQKEDCDKVSDNSDVAYLSNQQPTNNAHVVVERVIEENIQSKPLFESEMIVKDSKSSKMLAKMLVNDTTRGQSEEQIFIQTVAASVTEDLPKDFIQPGHVFVDQSTNQNYSDLNRFNEETIISSNEKGFGTLVEEISSRPIMLTSSTPIATQSTILHNPDTKTQVIRVEPTDMKTIKSIEKSNERKTSKVNEYDEVFDNVSGIIKDTILSIPGMRYFIMSKLPSITGIFASQTGTKVALSGSLMALLSSWKLLEKMSKLFSNLCHETSKDHSYSDKVLGYDNGKKDDALDNMSSLAKLTLVLQKLINEDNVPVDDALDDRCLSHVIKMVKQKIVQENRRVAETDQQLYVEVKQEVDEDEDAEEDTEDRQSYVCKICSRDCFSQVSLACHMSITHTGTTNTCYICQEILSSQKDLLIHIKDNHENKLATDSFKCSICNKKFCKQRYLKTHLKRHSGVKNHECPICGWKFFERTKLKWHMETHKAVDQRNLPYKCNVCFKSFYNRPAWSDHMNIHSGQKPFKCRICEASFGHRMGLKRHELVHKKECEFSCNHCGKGFKMASKLKEHMVRHTGVGDHTCQSCGKVYTTNNSLKRHVCGSSKNLSNEEVTYLPVAEEEALQPVTEVEPTQYMCSECNALFLNLEDAEVHAFSHSTQPGAEHQYQIDLGNGTSKLVYINNNEDAGSTMDGLGTIDGGYITCQEDLSTGTSNNKDDEQLVASTLAHLSSMNENIT